MTAMVRCRLNSERESETRMSSMEINEALQAFLDLTYPGLSPRQQAAKARNDLIQMYKLQLKQAAAPPCTIGDEEPAEPEQPKEIANRIASKAPAIDPGNWTRIAMCVEKSIERDRWDDTVEQDLIFELNKPFLNAINEFSVQNSRIRAFFDRHLW